MDYSAVSNANKGNQYAAKPVELKRVKATIFLAPPTIEILKELAIINGVNFRGKGEIFDRIIADYASTRLSAKTIARINKHYHEALAKQAEKTAILARKRADKINEYNRKYRMQKKLKAQADSASAG